MIIFTQKGLFRKGYMESKTLFFSLLRLFHYLLTLTYIAVHDSNNFMCERLIFYLRIPEGSQLKVLFVAFPGEPQKRKAKIEPLQEYILKALMLFFQIRNLHKNEFAKLRALRAFAPYVPSRLTRFHALSAFAPYVPSRQTCLDFYAP